MSNIFGIYYQAGGIVSILSILVTISLPIWFIYSLKKLPDRMIKRLIPAAIPLFLIPFLWFMVADMVPHPMVTTAKEFIIFISIPFGIIYVCLPVMDIMHDAITNTG